MSRAHRRFAREESGQEVIEFALASFVFLLTVFGTIEFGLAVWRYNMVSNLAQEGARWASVRGTSPGAISHASSGDVQTFVQSRSAGVPVTVTTAPGTVGDPGSTFSVTATSSFTPLTSLMPLTVTLQSTATMVVAR